MIVSEYGSVLTQKKEPKMVFIKPFIDMENSVLTLRCQGLFKLINLLKTFFLQYLLHFSSFYATFTSHLTGRIEVSFGSLYVRSLYCDKEPSKIR